MGHKTLIGGTAYDIKGGKTLIGGTAYDITAGKTLVGGTGYDISFSLPQTVESLFGNFVRDASAGRDSSSKASISISQSNLHQGTSYVFSFCNGYMGIYRVLYDGTTVTLTLVKNMSTSYGNVWYHSSSILSSSNGSQTLTAYALTMIAGHFTGYTPTQVENILQSLTFTRLAGANSSSRSSNNLQTSKANGITGYVFAAHNSYMGVSYVQGLTKQNIYGNHGTNPSLLYIFTSSGYITTAISTNGTSKLSAYGGSLIQAE